MSYTPQRTAYPFGDVNVRYRSRGDILKMEEQWNTFERVENYNDVVYQKFQQGLRDTMYYVFTNDQEFKNYKAGQQLHIITYPTLPCSTFDPISQRPMPDVAPVTALPYVTNTIQTLPNRYIPTASEQAAINADLAVYAHVSSYNAVHQLKYTFVDDEEKTAYERGCVRVNAT
jgi:hypothetical protein